MTRYHAVLFMCNDIVRAEWVSTNFKRHNPGVILTVYNGGRDDREVRTRVTADHYEAGENLWHRGTRCSTGSFGYGWFRKFFDYAEAEDADYTIYLETDVEVRRAITIAPKWDMSGPVNNAGPLPALVAYDYWGSYLRGQEFNEDVKPTPNKLHTGCGGTAFSRLYFAKTRRNLELVKNAFEKVPYVFYADLMATLLGRYSGCSFGDWSEVSNVNGSYRYDESRNEVFFESSCTDTAMIHGVKI